MTTGSTPAAAAAGSAAINALALPRPVFSAASETRLARVAAAFGWLIHTRMALFVDRGNASQLAHASCAVKAAAKSSGTTRFSMSSSAVQDPLALATSTLVLPAGSIRPSRSSIAMRSLFGRDQALVGLARAEPEHAALVVERVGQTVDPADGERLEHRFLVADPRPAGRGLPGHQPHPVGVRCGCRSASAATARSFPRAPGRRPDVRPSIRSSRLSHGSALGHPCRPSVADSPCRLSATVESPGPHERPPDIERRIRERSWDEARPVRLARTGVGPGGVGRCWPSTARGEGAGRRAVAGPGAGDAAGRAGAPGRHQPDRRAGHRDQ